MEKLSRTNLIELLDRLGAGSDEAALGAARDLHRSVSDAGLSWDDLLRPEFPSADMPVSAEAEPRPAAEAGKDDPVKWAEEAKIVDRLLARKGISDTLRGDLDEFRRGIADGRFDKMDADYVRALARRLGA